MVDLPIEIKEIIIQHVFSNCYLKNKFPMKLNECSYIDKDFRKFFKCKPTCFDINGINMTYCKHHDLTLLQNSYRILNTVEYNFKNSEKFMAVKILSENNSDISVPLVSFYLEPYISVMGDNEIYGNFNYENCGNFNYENCGNFNYKNCGNFNYKNFNNHISEINNRVIKPLFSALGIKYSRNENGQNFERLLNFPITGNIPIRTSYVIMQILLDKN
jgi:hypothetical protein